VSYVGQPDTAGQNQAAFRKDLIASSIVGFRRDVWPPIAIALTKEARWAPRQRRNPFLLSAETLRGRRGPLSVIVTKCSQRMCHAKNGSSCK
jgi:hypothetical protein